MTISIKGVLWLMIFFMIGWQWGDPIMYWIGDGIRDIKLYMSGRNYEQPTGY